MDKIILREPKYDDYQEFYRLIRKNYSKFSLFLPWVNNKFSIDLARKYIEYYIINNKKNIEFRYFIIDFDTKDIIGSFSLRNIDIKNNSGEIGFYLDSNYQGKGIIQKLFPEFINIISNKIKIENIYAKTLYNNYRSQKTLLRLNFSKIANDCGTENDNILLFKFSNSQ